MRLFRVQLRKELHELWGTRKAIIVLAVMLVFGFASPILAKVTPQLLESVSEGQNVTIIMGDVTYVDAIDQLIKNTNQIIVFLALLMSFNVVVGERERGLMTLVFPHGLPRTTFVLAKFAALLLLFAAGMLLLAIAGYVYTVLLFEAPDPGGYIAMVALLYIYLALIIALGILASTLGKSTVISVAIAFGFFVLVLMTGLFTDLDPGELNGWARALAIEADSTAQWGALVMTVAVSVVAVGASCIVLNRQEIE
jgi:ABC-2 type transport system permease protein